MVGTCFLGALFGCCRLSISLKVAPFMVITLGLKGSLTGSSSILNFYLLQAAC